MTIVLSCFLFKRFLRVPHRSHVHPRLRYLSRPFGKTRRVDSILSLTFPRRSFSCFSSAFFFSCVVSRRNGSESRPLGTSRRRGGSRFASCSSRWTREVETCSGESRKGWPSLAARPRPIINSSRCGRRTPSSSTCETVTSNAPPLGSRDAAGPARPRLEYRPHHPAERKGRPR